MSDRVSGILLCVLVGLAIVLGGSGFGVIGNLLLQLLALPVIFIAILRLARERLDNWTRAGLATVALIHLLPLLQLVPLSPALWTQMNGRDWIARGYVDLGIALPSIGISLSPEETLAWWLHLFPATGAFLLGLTVPLRERRWVAWVIVALTLVSTVLGIVQVATGYGYLYRITNIGSAVGFFANRNHLATLLVMAIPLTFLLLEKRRKPMTGTRLWTAIFSIFALILVMLVGILMAGSRAGFGLSLIAILLGAATGIRWSRDVARWVPAVAAIALVLAGVAVSTVALDPVTTTQAAVKTELQDKRIRAIPETVALGWKYFPWGSGLGAFDATFRTSTSDINLEDYYLNHAHNDYLETWLTAGVLGVGLIGIILIQYLGLLGRAWRARLADQQMLSRLGALSVGLALVHCAVDYPLRTIADATVFGVLAAFIYPAMAGAIRTIPRLPQSRVTVIE
ncbi:O-antigen ligase family protein [Sphingomonas hylomeconis]|uniref:O-antigen ligase family protein n=1 Tax=Sphingomonas hylomeconis TaxID=1395958 RepID=A0ABV7SWW7_9SPHN|nr:O-antigen ligase family protein [Sphingomonas hylomeconis]